MLCPVASPMTHGAYAFTAVPTDNPYTVDHGYGNTYSYQPVFTPTGVTEPTPAGATPTPSGGAGGISNEMYIIIALVIVILLYRLEY